MIQEETFNCMLDGRTYQLPLNDDGMNCLHGGTRGSIRRYGRLCGTPRTDATKHYLAVSIPPKCTTRTRMQLREMDEEQGG